MQINGNDDVSDKSPCSVGFSPRGSVIIREAWAKAHATSTSVGTVNDCFCGFCYGITNTMPVTKPA